MTLGRAKIILLSLPRIYKRFIAFFCDTFFCAFSVWLSFGLRLDEWGLPYGNQWWTLFFAIIISLPLFIRYGFYRAIFRYVGVIALTYVARAFATYTILFLIIFTIIGFDDVPRSIGFIQPLLLIFGVGISRFLVRYWLGDPEGVSRKLGQNKIALIYGAGIAGRQLAAGLDIYKEILVKGFIDDGVYFQGNTINGLNVYHSNHLVDLIHKLEVTDIFLAIPSESHQLRNQILSTLHGSNVRVRTLPGLFDMFSTKVHPSDLQNLDMNDLLGREVVVPNFELLNRNINNKCVLVTGAGGSIGSELCRQIIKLQPSALILVDSSEHALYMIYEELKRYIIDHEDHIGLNSEITNYSEEKIIPRLASIRDYDSVSEIFKTYNPDIVFHAAAYKHVPMVEKNYVEGIRNNIFGTLLCARIALNFNTAHFILVSTDKAVRPTNIMGASKRIAELTLQGLSEHAKYLGRRTCFSMVRFGNVLGSSGSVTRLFEKQIERGGPITLTNLNVTRYFMTIPEAAQLVIQSSSMALGGDVFVLDMGQPVRIYDLAVKMIRMSGFVVKDDLNPKGDIEIKISGLRSGEKLYEELLIGGNPQITIHPKIMKAHEEFFPWSELELHLKKLEILLYEGNIYKILEVLKILVPGFKPDKWRDN